jgi:DNA-binding transcriptional LysR family regulator
MDLVLLRSLIAVADHRTVTAASRALFVTQPALTRRLQQLEGELGAKLFVRSRSGVALTEAGRIALEEARAIVDRYGRIKEALAAHESLQTGIVRLGGGATAVSFLVPRAIAAFSRQYPGVRFEVLEAGSREVESYVDAERIELGIVTLPTHTRAFEVKPLARDRIVLVAAARHPLAKKKRVEVAELAGQTLVGFQAGSAIRQLIDAELRAAGVSMNVQMELRSIASILGMVLSTQALAFVSHLGVTGREHELSVIDVRGVRVARRLGVISKLGRPMSPAAKTFAKVLGETAAETH